MSILFGGYHWGTFNRSDDSAEITTGPEIMLKPRMRMIGQRKPNRNLCVFVASAFSVISVMALTGCGGGGGISHTYAVAGTVSGLTSPGLALSLNGSPNMPVASGATVVALTPALASGTSYNVTISTQPVGESCAVTGGVGTIGTQDITTVKVVCSKLAYSLGGTISGLSTNGLVLSNQGDTLTVAPGATTFAMPRKVAFASNYDVEVKAHPPGIQCSLADNSGLMPASPLTNINISCQQVEIVLHSFAGGTDGASPRGSLLQAPDGNLYGTTFAGGSSGLGTVFKITPAGQESVLYSFAGGSDGATPSGSLILASDGNLYGTTGSGGSGSGSGTVFKITLTGTEGVLYAFSGGADGQFPSGGLIQANDGQLYGTTAVGGTAGAGTVFVVNLSGSEKVLYSFGGAPDGYEPFCSLIQATDGDLYGLALGGCKGYGCVFRVTLAGAETILHSFVQGIDGAGPFGSLIQASDGNLYGMTSGGGVATGINPPGTVFRISLDGIESTVHNFLGGSDGTYPEGSLIQASDGNLYGLTTGGGAINVGVAFKISLSGSESILYSFAGGIDAAAPRGDLVQGTDGHFYSTSLTGGTNGFGTVFRIN